MFRFLTIEQSPSEAVVRILNDNVIGTPGQGMLYQHKGVLDKIYRIEAPFFVNLFRNDRVVGTCCFCFREVRSIGNKYHAFYIRYFSFREIFRRKLITDKKLSRRNSSIRKEIDAVLSGNGLRKQEGEKFYHFAYVDPANIRSAQLCDEFGFTKIREYATIIFNRINPRRNHKAAAISPLEEAEMKRLLEDFYSGYSSFSLGNLFGGRNYVVVKDQSGNVLAGMQASPDRWKILSLPGFSGKIISTVFPHLPISRKFFDKDYRFLVIEGVYFKPGHEKEIELLLEDLLASYNLNSAIIVVDAGSSLYRALRSIDLGLVDSLQKEVRGNVICRFNGFTSQEIQSFKDTAAYISGIDVT